MRPTEKDREAARMLVRVRDDFQSMRKRMDNRIGRKADYTVKEVPDKEDPNKKVLRAFGGTEQNIEQRSLTRVDREFFENIANNAKWQEQIVEKKLRQVLKRFSIYTEFLSTVKGVGEIAAGWIIAEYDIHQADTVSKLWQFTGLNPGMVPGKKRVENKDGTFSLVHTGEMVRGDRLTPGHVAPFNKRLRTAMVGVLADGLIKANLRYRNAEDKEYEEAQTCFRRIKDGKKQVIASAESYGLLYLEYKQRLTNEAGWVEESPGHRDRAAKRYMIKMFLRDLYVAWRTLEGLPVRKPYQEAYLGHKHGEWAS